MLIPALGFGYIMDHVKVWKLVFLFHILSLASIVIFVIYTPTEKHIYNTQVHQSAGMTAGFIGMNITTTTLMSMNQALISKSIAKCENSRGVFLAATAFFTTLGVLLIDGIGGRLYSKDVRNPFYFCIGAECFFLLLTTVFASMRQLRI